MRQSLVLFVFLISCGGGEGGDTAVTVLTDESQQSLCETFVDDICANPEFEGFCDDPCIVAGCPDAVADGHVDAECDVGQEGNVITAQDVEDCGATGEVGVCLMGGGCMFDALEAACSGV